MNQVGNRTQQRHGVEEWAGVASETVGVMTEEKFPEQERAVPAAVEGNLPGPPKLLRIL